MIPIRDNIPARRFPIMNWLIIIANLAVFVYQLRMNDEQLGRFFGNYGLVPAHFSSMTSQDFLTPRIFTLYPFFTNMFLHAGWLHFIANMWVLIIFGDNVENRMGSFGYLFFYLSCGILASVSHFALNLHSTVPALGASGAIAGVMAAYMILFPFAKVVLLVPVFFIPLFFDVPSFIYIGLWFLIQLWSGGMMLSHTAQTTGIAFFAHIGGFVAGLLLFRLFLKKRYRMS